jgi:hypothetical protein
MWDDSYVVFGRKFLKKKGNVKHCVAVMQQPVAKFGAKSSQIFMQSP